MRNKIIQNIAWLSSEQFFRLAVGFLIGAWTARYLKPDQYGMINYAMAFVGIFNPLANLNDLNSIAVREISLKPTKKYIILGSVFSLKLIGSLIALSLSIALVYKLQPNSYLLQNMVILIASSSCIFYIFNTIDCWFQYNLESKYSVIAKNLTFAISTLIKTALIIFKFPLIYFTCLVGFEYTVAGISLIIAYYIHGQNILKWRFSFKVAKRLIQDCWLLVLSGIAISIYLRIDQAMLGHMLNSSVVGIYAIAVRFSDICCFLPSSITASMIAKVVKSKAKSNQSFYHELQKIFDIMVLISLPTAIILTIISPKLVLLIYGESYLEASKIITIHVWSIVFVSLGIAKNVWVIAENNGLYSFFSALSGALINILLNLVLIPKYQATGAAFATLISYTFADYITCFIYPKAHKIGWMMTKSITLASPISSILKK